MYGLKHFKRVFIKNGPPLQLIYFVSDDCNCNCGHCNIKGNLSKVKVPLELDQICKIAAGLKGLLSLSLTGGEPFMCRDIAQIAQIFYRESGVRNLVIITNGTLTDQILTATENILRQCPRFNVFIGISLDAVGDNHDKIRGLAGAFASATETIKRLKALKQKYPLLSVATATVCSLQNQAGLGRTYEFIVNNLSPDAVGINLQRPSLWSQDIAGLDINRYREFVMTRDKDIKSGRLKGHPQRFLNRLFLAKEKIQYGLIEKIHMEKRVVTPCYAGRLLAVLAAGGDVSACEMFPASMGNISDFGYDFGRLWFSKEAEEVRKRILSQNCFCTYECAMTANIFFNPRYYFRLFKEFLHYSH